MVVMFSHIPRVCKNHARSSRAGGSGDIARPGAGRTPSCPATRCRGHFAHILATTRVKLEWFGDAYQNPKQRIEPTISLLASPRGGRPAVWVPRALSRRYLQTSAPMGLGSGLLRRLWGCGHVPAGAGSSTASPTGARATFWAPVAAPGMLRVLRSPRVPSAAPGAVLAAARFLPAAHDGKG